MTLKRGRREGLIPSGSLSKANGTDKMSALNLGMMGDSESWESLFLE